MDYIREIECQQDLSHEEWMHKILLNTLTSKENRKMFGSMWYEGKHEVFCHPGCILRCDIDGDEIITMHFSDPIYGSIELDKEQTNQIIKAAGLTNDILNFTFTRSKYGNDSKKTNTQASRRKKEQQEKFTDYILRLQNQG